MAKVGGGATIDDMPEPRFELHVKLLTGQTFTLQASPDDLVWQLKEKVRSIWAFPLYYQRIVFNGTMLSEEDETLGYYGIKTPSLTCHMASVPLRASELPADDTFTVHVLLGANIYKDHRKKLLVPRKWTVFQLKQAVSLLMVGLPIFPRSTPHAFSCLLSVDEFNGVVGVIHAKLSESLSTNNVEKSLARIIAQYAYVCCPCGHTLLSDPKCGPWLEIADSTVLLGKERETENVVALGVDLLYLYLSMDAFGMLWLR